MDFLKDTVTELMEGNKLINDLTWMRKKIEYLSSAFQMFKANPEENQVKEKSGVTGVDLGKFVQNAELTEVCKNYNKEIFDMNKRLDELKRSFDDLSLAAKAKVSDKDLKNLESKINLLNLLKLLKTNAKED